MSNTSYIWKASQFAFPDMLKLSYKESGVLGYNVSWLKAPEVTSTLAGTVTVSNPTAEAVTLSSVSIQPEITTFEGQNSGAIPAVAAACKVMTLPPNTSTTCSYNTVIFAGGNGQVVADVELANGRSVLSAPAAFVFQGGSGATAAGPNTCAEIVSGLMLGTVLLLPGAAGAIKSTVTKVCDSGSAILEQPVGPFKSDQCGRYVVSSWTAAATFATTASVAGLE